MDYVICVFEGNIIVKHQISAIRIRQTKETDGSSVLRGGVGDAMSELTVSGFSGVGLNTFIK